MPIPDTLARKITADLAVWGPKKILWRSGHHNLSLLPCSQSLCFRFG